MRIDGSMGEGGGQVLRTALALSLVTGTPLELIRIRAGRARPGLMRQHLTAVQAAAAVGRAVVRGAEVGSSELYFKPTGIFPADYTFSVGTAGSATLVLQTVLPALLTAAGPSTLTLEGGTHNPLAPPFDFLEKVYLPLVERLGPRISAELERPGFFPAGGGCFRVRIEPAPRLDRLELIERGALRRRQVTAVVSNLSVDIAKRELAAFAARLPWGPECLRVATVRASGPGNVVMAELESENLTELFTGFGQKRVRAEAVGEAVAEETAEYLEAGVPVGSHLADQLLLPMALAGGGAMHTLRPTMHTLTQCDLLPRFLDVRVRREQRAEKVWHLEVERTGG